MSDVTLLRTLTEKSQMKFGRYADFTVREIMATVKDHKNYLAFCYFSCDMISFHDDVLKEIGITEELKIKKPGNISRDKTKDILYQLRGDLSLIELCNISSEKKGNTRRYNVKKNIREDQFFTAKAMQSRNQGH